jgi:hypothetical protein
MSPKLRRTWSFRAWFIADLAPGSSTDVVLDEDRVSPVRGGVAVEQSEEAVAVRVSVGAGDRGERGGEVDVLRHRVGGRPRGHAGTDDHERNVDVGIERGQLPGHEAVLAHVEAVVRAEHQMRVAADPVRRECLLDRSDHPVDRLHRLRATSEGRVDLGDLFSGESRVPGQPLRRVGREHVEVRSTRSAHSREVA